MLILGFLMLTAVSMIGIGFIIALLGILFLNWGRSATYDYTGYKMMKRNAQKKVKKNKN